MRKFLLLVLISTTFLNSTFSQKLKKLDKLLDEEALRVIKSSPLWIPGFNDQLPVDVLFTFPIVFQLR